jgi:hypothetical protein
VGAIHRIVSVDIPALGPNSNRVDVLLRFERPSHREIDAGPCKKNVRVNVQPARKSLTPSQTVRDMLSQQVRPPCNFADICRGTSNCQTLTYLCSVKEPVRAGTGELLNDPGVLEALCELWHPDR